MTEREKFRREIALQCLLVFIEFPGDKEDKVRASVEYANKLSAILDETEEGNATTVDAREGPTR